MNAYDTLFAIDCVAGGIAMLSIGGIIHARFAVHNLRAERDSARGERDAAREALREEQTEGDHFRELANDALANIKDLRLQLSEAMAGRGRWAAMYLKAMIEARQIQRAWDAEKQAYSARQRERGIRGNKSEKRRTKRSARVAQAA